MVKSVLANYSWPALECGWYTQWHSAGGKFFLFQQVSIANSFLVRGNLCPLPDLSPGRKVKMQTILLRRYKTVQCFQLIIEFWPLQNHNDWTWFQHKAWLIATITHGFEATWQAVAMINRPLISLIVWTHTPRVWLLGKLLSYSWLPRLWNNYSETILVSILFGQ